MRLLTSLFILATIQSSSSMMMDFHPLPCNADLALASCTPWSAFANNATDASTGVVAIPCGECVELDVSGDIELGGLDVVGEEEF